MTRTGWLLVAMVLLGWSAEARADADAKEARAQFARGVELHAEGKFDQAVIAFGRAYELKPSFKILYNIAQTENELAHYAAALSAYERYLADGGKQVPAKRRKTVEEEIERLRTLVGTIVVTGAEAGAQVFVDNRALGETPLAEPLRLDIGDHEVLIRLGGKEIHKEIVRVAGGVESAVHYEIAEEAPSAPPPPTETSPAPDGTDDGPQRVWTWVALGIGGAAGIAGGVIGGLALRDMKDIEGECADGHCPEARLDDRDRVEQLALTADILYGVAAAGVAAGVVLFFVEPKLGDEGSAEIVAAPAVTPGSTGIVLTGRF